MASHSIISRDLPESSRDSESVAGEENTWIARVQQQTEELRALFNLPQEENVCDDFVCALKKKVLLQGRMYVFEKHVCFRSSLFGFSKDKVIPLKDVTAVRKRKHYGFPNSVEIVWRGKREFFTSFLSRDDAWNIINLAWHQCSGYAKLFGAVEPLEVQMKPGLVSRIAANNPSLVRNVSGLGQPHGSSPEASKASARSLDSSPRQHGPERSAVSATSVSSRSPTPSPAPPPSAADAAPVRVVAARVSADAAPQAYRPESQPAPDASARIQTRSKSMDMRDSSKLQHKSMTSVEEDDRDSNYDTDEESVGDAAGDDEGWVPIPEPAPPQPTEGSWKVAEATLQYGVRDFFKHLLSDEGNYLKEFQETRGDKEVRLSRWRQHENVGRIRELQFITMLKSRIGPPQAHCHQTQRYRVFAGGTHLVFESSQTMNDIPYGDHFTVEARWDVTALPANQCKVEVSLRVPFSKSTLWKKQIEKGTLESCKDFYNELFARAQENANNRKLADRDGSSRATSASPSGVLPPKGSPAAPMASSFSQPQRALSTGAGRQSSVGPNVEDLLRRIDPEYRDDLQRMLQGGQGDSEANGGPGRRRSSFAERLLSGRLLSRSPSKLTQGALGATTTNNGSRLSGIAVQTGQSLQGSGRRQGGQGFLGLDKGHIMFALIGLLIIALQVCILSRPASIQHSTQSVRSVEGMDWGQQIDALTASFQGVQQQLEALREDLKASLPSQNFTLRPQQL